MSIEYMRHKVAEAYDGDSWKKRVSRMPDTQVEAIYDRLLESGRICNVPSSKVGCRRFGEPVEGTVYGRKRIGVKAAGVDLAGGCGEKYVVVIDEQHDETAYVSGKDLRKNRVRTDAIPGQLTFEDL